MRGNQADGDGADRRADADRRAPEPQPDGAPVVAETPEPDGGPVMVTIEYRVQGAHRTEFVAAMQAVREMRRRNGAYFWQLFHDAADPTRYVECFMDESWVEHLRQHERASVADRELQARAKRFLVEGTTTQSSHWLGDRAP